MCIGECNGTALILMMSLTINSMCDCHRKPRHMAQPRLNVVLQSSLTYELIDYLCIILERAEIKDGVSSDAVVNSVISRHTGEATELQRNSGCCELITLGA